jgi:hypothetical protein
MTIDNENPAHCATALRYARGVGVAVGYRGLTAIDIETDNNEILASRGARH